MPATLSTSAQDRPSIVQKTQSCDGKVKPCKYSTGLRRLALPVVCSSKRKAGLQCVRPDAATPASVTARGIEVLDFSVAKAAIAIFKSAAVFNRETLSSLCSCIGPDRNIGSRNVLPPETVRYSSSIVGPLLNQPGSRRIMFKAHCYGSGRSIRRAA